MSKEKVERLKQIKEAIEKLGKEKEDIEKYLDDLVVYQNLDGTWTRFTKSDNLKELEEKGTIFRASSIGRFSTKIENLKNPPKELKSLND